MKNYEIEISGTAKEELIRQNITGENFLRLIVKPGGCSGMSYDAQVDQTINQKDEVVYHIDEIKIVADSESAQYLNGLTVDYSNDLIKAGFRFNNPQAKKSCGCGASFQV